MGKVLAALSMLFSLMLLMSVPAMAQRIGPGAPPEECEDCGITITTPNGTITVNPPGGRPGEKTEIPPVDLPGCDLWEDDCVEVP